MRSVHLRSPSFAAGFTLGLVLTGVTYALGRVLKRRVEARSIDGVAHPVIDGAKPINPVDLEVGPPIEPGAAAIRLESEMPDASLKTQRW